VELAVGVVLVVVAVVVVDEVVDFFWLRSSGLLLHSL